MSYSIFYDKQFIKAEKDGKEVFFPMVITGSNNSYEATGGKRSRSWENLAYVFGNKKQYGTLEEMLSFVEADRLKVIKHNEDYIKDNPEWDKYSDERWGYFTSISFGGGCKATFGQWKGLFITGCKKALTIQELAELNVDVTINTVSFYYMPKELERLHKAGKEEISYTVKTSKELIEKLEEFKEYLKDFPKVSLYIHIGADEQKLSRIRKQKFPTKKTKPEYKEVDKYFVIYILKYGYLYSSRGSRFRYSPFQNSGKAFASQKKAESYIKNFKKWHGTYETAIEEVNEKTTIKI